MASEKLIIDGVDTGLAGSGTLNYSESWCLRRPDVRDPNGKCRIFSGMCIYHTIQRTASKMDIFRAHVRGRSLLFLRMTGSLSGQRRLLLKIKGREAFFCGEKWDQSSSNSPSTVPLSIPI